MFDLAEKLEFTMASEDGWVLDALAHAMCNESARGEYMSALGEDGKPVDISKRFGEYSTHELAIQPEAYDPELDIDFTQLRDQDLRAEGFGTAA